MVIKMAKMYKSGRLRGEVIEYSDGVGCCIWIPFGEDGEMEDAGSAFDFSLADIDDMIALLNQLKSAEPDIFEYEEGVG